MKRYICTDKSPAKTDALLSASEEELRVLVLLLAADEPLSAEDLQAQAGLATLGDAKDALAFWRGAGLIRTATKKKEPAPAVAEEQEDVPAVEEKPPKKKKPVRAADELPTYSGSTLSEMIERDNLASALQNVADRRASRRHRGLPCRDRGSGQPWARAGFQPYV